MSNSVAEGGREVFKGTSTENTNAVTPISINASTAITLPAIPTGNAATAGNRPNLLTGPLECLLVIEGTQNSRFTINGVTPTAAVGQLIVPSNGVASMTLRGLDVIKAFRIIGVAGGNTITFEFMTTDQGN